MTSPRNYAGIGGLIVVAAIVTIFAAYIGFGSPGSGGTTSSSTSSETTMSQIQGIVTGYVTVGPSQPVCPANQSCNVNLTGYSLVFTSVCSGESSCQVQTFLAPLSPSGHFSILLHPGEYSVTGLSPSCSWMGCSSTFPQSVVVVGGSQLVMDFNVDTGIR
jgi:hypothetical protein